jgi:putative DNA primase/helicase
LGYDFDRNAKPPAEWLRFLGELWGNDQESIDALQEWFGYLLTADTAQQKILMIVGPKRSGKGTIARLLSAVVGRQNCSSPTLSGLATNFGLAPLIGKTVAIFADARLSGRVDSQVIVERLLSISGEDSQTIDRKHLTSWTGNLPTRFVLISNELPRLGDSSGAMPSRMVVLNLTKSFFGKEDTDLTRRLLAELPSILLWSIAGWARLHDRGWFTQPASSKGLLEDLESLSSPIASFVADHCEINPESQTPIKEIFDAWKEWCKEQGKEHPGDHAGFGRSLRAAVPSLKTVQIKEGEGSDAKKVRVFRGLRLSGAPF